MWEGVDQPKQNKRGRNIKPDRGGIIEAEIDQHHERKQKHRPINHHEIGPQIALIGEILEVAMRTTVVHLQPALVDLAFATVRTAPPPAPPQDGLQFRDRFVHHAIFFRNLNTHRLNNAIPIAASTTKWNQKSWMLAPRKIN